MTKDRFGEHVELDADESRRIIRGIVSTMTRRAHNVRRQIPAEAKRAGDDSPNSPQKELYGDAWRLLFGIVRGMDLMEEGRRRHWDEESGEFRVGGITEGKWREHYGEYGSGPYGRGLKIGKKLAFYEETQFEFVSSEEGEEGDDSPEFTFV